MVAPDKAGTYLYASPGRIFSAGDTLGVSAAGDMVPAFPAQTVTVLPVLALAFPAVRTACKLHHPDRPAP